MGSWELIEVKELGSYGDGRGGGYDHGGREERGNDVHDRDERGRVLRVLREHDVNGRAVRVHDHDRGRGHDLHGSGHGHDEHGRMLSFQ